jgi:FKBP-type peptidyl-prolyl cis-trans isomerase
VASTPAAPPATPATSNPATTPTTPPPAEKVEIEDIKEGTGEPAKTGDLVAVHYTGTLKDGSKFDSSRDKGEPFIFTLGQGKVIQGWEQGIAGMKPGGRRKLTIPPSLGYGSTARPKIPANSTLLFDVELIKVIPGATK